MASTVQYDQFFLSYSGARLPLNMVGGLPADEIANRNTFFGVCIDDQQRTVLIHKVLYGELELQHRYGYHDNGALAWAEILDDEGEQRLLQFDGQGQLIAG